jgi:hypothetical protein
MDWITKLTQALEAIRTAPTLLDDLRQRYPGITDADLFARYQEAMREAMAGLSPGLVAQLVQDSFRELKSGSTGYGPEHGGVA